MPHKSSLNSVEYWTSSQINFLAAVGCLTDLVLVASVELNRGSCLSGSGFLSLHAEEATAMQSFHVQKYYDESWDQRLIHMVSHMVQQ
ncbi:hypothetical protein SDJN02_20584, partial [Cucurbita argyrosperma subsp. argyrosperma]